MAQHKINDKCSEPTDTSPCVGFRSSYRETFKAKLDNILQGTAFFSYTNR